MELRRDEKQWRVETRLPTADSVSEFVQATRDPSRPRERRGGCRVPWWKAAAVTGARCASLAEGGSHNACVGRALLANASKSKPSKT